MKKLKRKLGLFYWKSMKRIGEWKYRQRKTFRQIKTWVQGWRCKQKGDGTVRKNVQYLVVCAHPDDETIFFSSILKSKKPFVICVSHRGDKVRVREFYDALRYWDVGGIMLNFPDVPGMTFVWRWRMCAVLARLRKSMPLVSTVYTHSSSGESGHPHHYAVNRGVKKAFSQCRILTTAVTIPEDKSGRLEDTAVAEKYAVIRDCYPSQINMLERWCPWWQDYLTIEYFER